MSQFIWALIIVFGIGMLIRWAIRRGKKSSAANAAVPPPQSTAAPAAPAGFCAECGRPATGDSAFCGNCGAKLK